MVNQAEIKQAYYDIYSALRNYIWPYNIVEGIAELEISAMQTCPNIPQIRGNLYGLKSALLDTIESDEQLSKAFDNFNNVLSADDYYVKLNAVNEVVADENN